MSPFREKLLLAYLLLCPWCTGVVTIYGTRLAASDLLLPLALLCIAVTVQPRQWNMQQLGLLTYGAIASISVIPLISGSFLGVMLLKVLRLWGILAPALLVTQAGVASFPLKTAVRCFFWSGFASVLFGVVAFFFQWDFGIAVQSYQYGGQYLRRAGGVFLDASSFGHLLSTWFVFSVFFVLPTVTGTVRRACFLVFAGLLLAYGLYSSVSRAALLHVLVVGVGALLLPRRLSEFRITKFMIPVGLGLMGVVVWTSDLWNAPSLDSLRFIFERLVNTAQAAMDGTEALDRSGGNRLSGWGTALQLWLANPILGVGYKALVPGYGIFADNTLVLTLVETGILGCIAFTLTGLGFLAGAVRVYLAEMPFGRALLLFWLGQLTHSLLVDTITFCGSTTLVLMMAIVMVLRIRSAESSQPQIQSPDPHPGHVNVPPRSDDPTVIPGRRPVWPGLAQPWVIR